MSRKVSWRARYDSAALRPPALLPRPTAAEWTALQPLRRWCLEGAVPRMQQPLAMAVLDAGHPDTALRVQQLCLERDGSWQLAACKTAIDRMGLRLKTKLHDLMPDRDRQADDAWDAGYAIGTPQGQQALAGFMPRRATLIVMQQMQPAVLQQLVQQLAERQSTWAHPVRLLVLGKASKLQLGGLTLTRLD